MTGHTAATAEVMAATPSVLCRCPRCCNEYERQFFVMCGGCVIDIALAHRGLPPQHFMPAAALFAAGA